MKRGQTKLAEGLGKYKTLAMEDLVWALTSPSIVDHPLAVQSDWGLQELAGNQGIVGRLDRADSNLHRAAGRVGHRLGDYFETLITSWLRELPPAKVMASNLQVHGGEGTVGEFDLVFSRDRVVHHWELAVKYYLAHPNRVGGVYWYGPNPKDRFSLKWTKMRDRQLHLSHTPEGGRELRRLGIQEDVVPGAMVKGHLYKPLVADWEAELPPEANPDAPMGWWLPFADAPSLADAFDQELRWMSLPRLRWMSRAHVLEPQTLVLDELLAKLDSTRPHHVVGLRVEGKIWVEQTRGFIVPEGWPFDLM